MRHPLTGGTEDVADFRYLHQYYAGRVLFEDGAYALLTNDFVSDIPPRFTYQTHQIAEHIERGARPGDCGGSGLNQGNPAFGVSDRRNMADDEPVRHRIPARLGAGAGERRVC